MRPTLPKDSNFFTALIQSDNAQNQLIASFSEDGDSNYSNNGSVIFTWTCQGPGIANVFFGLSPCSDDCADFEINQLDIALGEGVREPSSILLLCSRVALILAMPLVRTKLYREWG